MKTKRTIKKQVWFSEEEDREFKRKCRKANLPQSTMFRMLVMDYEPKEQPDERFYDVMRELWAIGNNIHQLTAKAQALNFIDAPMLEDEALKWAKFQSKIWDEFLSPVKKERSK